MELENILKATAICGLTELVENWKLFDKAEIIYEDGKFLEVVIKDVAGKKPLDTQNLKKFKKLVEYY